MRHRRVVHENGKEHSCPACGFKAFDGWTLRNHIQNKHGENPSTFSCDICKKCFSTKGGLINHMKTHTGTYAHKCELCDKSYIYLDELKRHKYKIHGIQDDSFICSKCGKCLSSTTNRFKHERICGITEKSYKCIACAKIFMTNVYLKNHFKRVHTEREPEICQLCGKTYAKESLARHMRKKHNVQ